MLYIFWKIEVYSFQNWQNILKNLNEEEHGWYKNEELEIIKELFSPYYKHCLNFFSIDDSYYYLTEFYQKNFLMATLRRNVPKLW